MLTRVRWALVFGLPFVLGACLVVQMRPQSTGLAVGDGAVRPNVEAHVRALSGPRNLFNREAYEAAAAYIKAAWEAQGYPVSVEPVMPGADNLVVTLQGGPGIVLLGAHYDSYSDAGGADDNASGVAAMLEVSRLLQGRRLLHTVRFVAFANEEPPFFQRHDMGSMTHASNAKTRGDDLRYVLALDAVGYYSDAPGSQEWPMGLGLVMPDRADFIAVVADMRSAAEVRRVSSVLRAHSSVPIAAAAVPAWITGVDWSDHWSFWQEGYRAVLLTDMPVFRDPHYHEPTDLPDTLDFDRLARFTAGLAGALDELAGSR